MAPPELPPALLGGELVKLVAAMRSSCAATLAAALIIGAGRSHSVGEAMKVYNDVYFSLFSDQSSGIFQGWKKTFDPDRVHS